MPVNIYIFVLWDELLGVENYKFPQARLTTLQRIQHTNGCPEGNPLIFLSKWLYQKMGGGGVSCNKRWLPAIRSAKWGWHSFTSLAKRRHETFNCERRVAHLRRRPIPTEKRNLLVLLVLDLFLLNLNKRFTFLPVTVTSASEDISCTSSSSSCFLILSYCRQILDRHNCEE